MEQTRARPRTNQSNTRSSRSSPTAQDNKATTYIAVQITPAIIKYAKNDNALKDTFSIAVNSHKPRIVREPGVIKTYTDLQHIVFDYIGKELPIKVDLGPNAQQTIKNYISNKEIRPGTLLINITTKTAEYYHTGEYREGAPPC